MTRPAYGAPDGYGLYGVLGRDVDGRVVCHECGRACEQLATHLRYSHGMSAVEYRAVHGLSTGTKLLGTATLGKLSASWHEHEAEHLARLERTRDVGRARSLNTREAQWRPELIARRREQGAATRRDLTAGQAAELGDITDMQGWADRARALMARDGVSIAAIGRAVDMSTGGVNGRLRRYPATDPLVRPEPERIVRRARDVTWQRIAELQRFVAWHGRMPTPADDPDLRRWVTRVRTHRLADPVAVAALEAIPGWSWRPERRPRVLGRAWQARFESLARYALAHGHASPGYQEVWDNRRVGTWVQAQRQAHRRGVLPAAQVAMLEGLPGWRWRAPRGRTKAPACTR